MKSNILESSCPEPMINHGTVNPVGSINSGQKVTVTCNSGYTINSTGDMTCTRGQFDEKPTCEGNLIDFQGY